ncbi:MAG: hypothetical protein ACYC2H_06675 [Thermoplasmatota archaeon]
MQPRLALVLAVATGGLAITAVALDLAYGLEASLDAKDGDGWRTASSTEEQSYGRSTPFSPGCSGPEMRLAVHNDRLVSSRVDVFVAYYDASGNEVVVLRDTWGLDRGETRTHEFTVPSSAFAQVQGVKPTISVNAQVDGHYLGTCVQEAA